MSCKFILPELIKKTTHLPRLYEYIYSFLSFPSPSLPFTLRGWNPFSVPSPRPFLPSVPFTLTCNTPPRQKEGNNLISKSTSKIFNQKRLSTKLNSFYEGIAVGLKLARQKRCSRPGNEIERVVTGGKGSQGLHANYKKAACTEWKG